MKTSHHPVPLSWNLGTLTSWNPLGHSRPVTGLLFLFLPYSRTLYLYVNKLKSDFFFRYQLESNCGTTRSTENDIYSFTAANPSPAVHSQVPVIVLSYPLFASHSVCFFLMCQRVLICEHVETVYGFSRPNGRSTYQRGVEGCNESGVVLRDP